MKRPEIDIRNHQELYEYYKQLKISPIVAQLGHFVSDAAYRTKGHTHIADGARDAIAGATLDANRAQQRVMMAGNHLSMADPFALAAAFRSQAELNPLMEHTSIVAKHTIQRNKLARVVLDPLGAVPAFLSKRTRDLFDTEEEHRAAQRGAATGLGDAIVAGRMVSAGNHVVMYGEVGGRGTDIADRDPRIVRPIHKGLGHIALDAGETLDVILLPVGVAYAGDTMREHRKPEIVIGNPLDISGLTGAQEVADVVQIGIQEAVDEAYWYVDQRAA